VAGEGSYATGTIQKRGPEQPRNGGHHANTAPERQSSSELMPSQSHVSVPSEHNLDTDVITVADIGRDRMALTSIIHPSHEGYLATPSETCRSASPDYLSPTDGQSQGLKEVCSVLQISSTTLYKL